MIDNQVIFNTIDNGIIVLDRDLNVHAWNNWLEIRTDVYEKDIIGINICEKFSYIDEKKLKRKIKSVLVTKNPSFYGVDPHQYLIDIKVNSIMEVVYESMQQDITIVPYDIEKGLVCLYIYDKTSIYDINYKLEQLNKKLIDLSNKDYLTKAYNRRYFEEFSKKMISLGKRNEQRISIIALDVDHFKKINDNYGHAVGDEVLVSFTKILEKSIRDSDIVSRFGGEEFMIFLYDASIDNALNIAFKIRDLIENTPIEVDDIKLNITASLGVAQYCEEQDKENIQNTVKRADNALYEAKTKGRNLVVLSK